ncbi:MAG: hypothetical protein KJ645_07255, partial [Planctomycetes bacterium]|nr:hypothetical protein [Planctomycetota bacterium]
GDPLVVYFDQKTPYGETAQLDVQINFDGYALTQHLSMICGVPSIMASYDMESDQGWSIENTAITNGEWERADPVGTDAQPENDHTPAGTQCYVTGKLGGTAGNDDLDGGPTRLISPTIDLSAGTAEVSYWLWFHHTDYGIQNPLQVDLSNNDGADWTPVTTITHKPQWTQYSFNVADYLTPTDQMKIRFTANDNPNDDVVEALLDDFEVKTYASPVGLSLIGTPAIGSNVNIAVDAPTDGGLGYFLAASTIVYPVSPIGDRYYPLAWDYILAPLSITPGNGIFNNFVGYLDGAGYSADPQFAIPYMPILVGVDIYFAAITLDASYPEGIKNISAPLPITVQ